MFLVIVVPPVEVDAANTKELHEHPKTLDAFRALRHRKLMCHLDPGSITSTIISMRLTDKVD
jgi:hypothetical protein